MLLASGLALALAALCATGSAQVQFSKPASGAPATLADGKLLVEWFPTGASDDLEGYSIQLMAGGDSEDTAGEIATVSGTSPLSDGASSAQLAVPTGAGPLATNAYFLRLSVRTSDGEDAAFYSDRFSVVGMTGSFPASAAGKSAAEVEEAYRKVKSDITAVPNLVYKRQVIPAGAANTAAAAGDAPPYSLQTAGAVKTAPMQQNPGTAITAQNTVPLYPTSAYDIARSALPVPTFDNTITMPRTYATSSIENQASAAAAPSNDMARFLNRWKD